METTVIKEVHRAIYSLQYLFLAGTEREIYTKGSYKKVFSFLTNPEPALELELKINYLENPSATKKICDDLLISLNNISDFIEDCKEKFDFEEDDECWWVDDVSDWIHEAKERHISTQSLLLYSTLLINDVIEFTEEWLNKHPIETDASSTDRPMIGALLQKSNDSEVEQDDIFEKLPEITIHEQIRQFIDEKLPKFLDKPQAFQSRDYETIRNWTIDLFTNWRIPNGVQMLTGLNKKDLGAGYGYLLENVRVDVERVQISDAKRRKIVATFLSILFGKQYDEKEYFRNPGYKYLTPDSDSQHNFLRRLF